MAGNSGNDFALELMVGIKDMFTQKAKQIDAEVNKLDKDAKDLQKTFDDVSAYQKATQALEDLMKQGDASAEQLQAQERIIDNLAKNLKKAGVDINNVTREEQRLSRQVQETNTQLSKRTGLKDMFKGGLSMVASAGLLYKFMSMSDDVQKAQIEMRKLSNYSMADITNPAERNYRRKMKGTYNIDAGEVMGVQTLFNQQSGLSGQQNQKASEYAIKLSKLTNYDEEEVVSALSPLINSGVSPEKAASLIYSTFKKTGDQKHDLLDTVQEYYSNLHSSGMSAEQFFAALQAGQRTGVFNYDKIGDSLKETFNARLADSGTIQTLLGNSKTKGAIEGIADGSLKYKFRNQINGFISDMSKGLDTTHDVGDIYKSLGEIKDKSPLAYQQIATLIGGGMLAEDAGKNAAAPIGNALQNANSVLGKYSDSMGIDPKELLTTKEQYEAAQKVATDGMANSAADATKQLDGFAGTLQSVSQWLSGTMTNHPILSTVGSGLMGLGTVGGNIFSGYVTLKGLKAFMGSGAAASETEGVIGGILAKGTGIGAGLAGKGMGLLGKAGPWAVAASGIYTAYEDDQKGDRKGADKALGGTAGTIAGAEFGAGLGSAIFPGVGTIVGGALGAAGGWFLGSGIGGKIADWWDDDNKNDPTQQRFKSSVDALPTPDDNMVSADSATLPDGLNITISQPITIQAMSANPDDISKAVEEALRQSNPELIQQLEYALSQIMATNDHQRPSN